MRGGYFSQIGRRVASWFIAADGNTAIATPPAPASAETPESAEPSSQALPPLPPADTEIEDGGKYFIAPDGQFWNIYHCPELQKYQNIIHKHFAQEYFGLAHAPDLVAKGWIRAGLNVPGELGVTTGLTYFEGNDLDRKIVDEIAKRAKSYIAIETQGGVYTWISAGEYQKWAPTHSLMDYVKIKEGKKKGEGYITWEKGDTGKPKAVNAHKNPWFIPAAIRTSDPAQPVGLREAWGTELQPLPAPDTQIVSGSKYWVAPDGRFWNIDQDQYLLEKYSRPVHKNFANEYAGAPHNDDLIDTGWVRVGLNTAHSTYMEVQNYAALRSEIFDQFARAAAGQILIESHEEPGVQFSAEQFKNSGLGLFEYIQDVSSGAVMDTIREHMHFSNRQTWGYLPHSSPDKDLQLGATASVSAILGSIRRLVAYTRQAADSHDPAYWIEKFRTHTEPKLDKYTYMDLASSAFIIIPGSQHQYDSFLSELNIIYDNLVPYQDQLEAAQVIEDIEDRTEQMQPAGTPTDGLAKMKDDDPAKFTTPEFIPEGADVDPSTLPRMDELNRADPDVMRALFDVLGEGDRVGLPQRPRTPEELAAELGPEAEDVMARLPGAESAIDELMQRWKLATPEQRPAIEKRIQDLHNQMKQAYLRAITRTNLRYTAKK